MNISLDIFKYQLDLNDLYCSLNQYPTHPAVGGEDGCGPIEFTLLTVLLTVLFTCNSVPIRCCHSFFAILSFDLSAKASKVQYCRSLFFRMFKNAILWTSKQVTM